MTTNEIPFDRLVAFFTEHLNKRHGGNSNAMNTSRLILYATAALLLGLASCNTNATAEKADTSASARSRTQVTNNAAENKMRITIGSKTYEATLEDNATVAKLKSLLPLTLKMIELNGNEKYHNLSPRLPTDAISPRTIANGDLMLYRDNSLVLFYKTFETTYSYTRLGRIDNPSGLADAVGTGDVSVTFESE